MTLLRHTSASILITFVSSLFLTSAMAGGFDATVSPPKFEFDAKAGDVIRQVVNINNMSDEAASYKIHTEDWEFLADNRVQYHAGTPKPYSCRPWTRIERHSLTIPGKRQRPYRFEIHIPKEAKATACRFALIIGPDPKAISPVQLGGMSLPIVGRIAVIIYVTVGGAKPVLEMKSISMSQYQSKTIPVALFSNLGNAHARPSGVLQAKDSKNRTVELWVGALPLLPKQTREIPLYPMDWSSGSAKDAEFTLEPPIHVRGDVQWGDSKLKLDQIIY